MTRYKSAIVRPPTFNYINCVSNQPDKDSIDVKKAIQQHSEFVNLLNQLGISTVKLPGLGRYPDSCFVEDTAVVIDNKALICRLKELSRQGEEADVQNTLSNMVSSLFTIRYPAIMEGGNVIVTENEIFLGINSRTNEEGVEQFKSYFKDRKISVIRNFEALHLKAVCTYIGKNTFVLDPLRIDKGYFHDYSILTVDPDESYAANCIGINNRVIIPDHYPKILNLIKKAGFQTPTLDVSEFRKGDAGVTCLAILF